MCGLVGMAGKLQAKHDKVIKSLLILDSLRGTDSTGIAAIGRNNASNILAKQIGDPFQLFEYGPFGKAIQRFNRAIIGHNRYATQGKVNRTNAHPFEFDNIIGAHNGTLRNKHKLIDSECFTVDSENLFHHIEEKGLDDALEVLDGAWALVWWDKVNEELNFLRNKERPLFLCKNEDKDVLFWASEPWMLEVAIPRGDEKHSQIYPLDEDVLFTVPVDPNGNLGALRCTPAKSKFVPPPVQANFTSGGTNHGVSRLPAPRSNQVIEFSPKARVVPKQPKKVPTVSEYSGSKGVLLEILGLAVDSHGGRYVSCFDPENRSALIRLYLKPVDDETKLVGEEITATIGKFYKTKEASYYKVEYASFKMVQKPKEYVGHDGKLVPEHAWVKKYGSCCWCSANIFPRDRFSFTTEGEAVCEDCSSNSDVMQYVKLSNIH